MHILEFADKKTAHNEVHLYIQKHSELKTALKYLLAKNLFCVDALNFKT